MIELKKIDPPDTTTGFSVIASPYNAVKMDLTVLALLGVIVWMIHDQITTQFYAQIFILGGYGCATLVWIIRRVRQVDRELAQNVQ